MIIDCVADLHGHYPKLEGGDLLIVAGDLTSDDSYASWDYLFAWIWEQEKKYKLIVCIAGNHDVELEKGFTRFDYQKKTKYICDTGIEFEGLKIWGSPWTAYFEGMNPRCMAFTLNYGCDTDDWLAEKWALIPDDIDILITHAPPYGILDKTISGECVGSKSLKKAIGRIMPELVTFGHIHENGGQYVQENRILYINGSIVDERYRNTNRPRKIFFDEKMPKMQRFKVLE